jgi:hypothetical protein
MRRWLLFLAGFAVAAVAVGSGLLWLLADVWRHL